MKMTQLDVMEYRLWSFKSEDTKLVRSLLLNGYETVWQYGMWSFQRRYTKLERFLPKNQHTQRKLMNFEFWIDGDLNFFITKMMPYF